jgi:hypothetical protein
MFVAPRALARLVSLPWSSYVYVLVWVLGNATVWYWPLGV